MTERSAGVMRWRRAASVHVHGPGFTRRQQLTDGPLDALGVVQKILREDPQRDISREAAARSRRRSARCLSQPSWNCLLSHSMMRNPSTRKSTRPVPGMTACATKSTPMLAEDQPHERLRARLCACVDAAGGSVECRDGSDRNDLAQLHHAEQPKPEQTVDRRDGLTRLAGSGSSCARRRRAPPSDGSSGNSVRFPHERRTPFALWADQRFEEVVAPRRRDWLRSACT